MDLEINLCVPRFLPRSDPRRRRTLCLMQHRASGWYTVMACWGDRGLCLKTSSWATGTVIRKGNRGGDRTRTADGVVLSGQHDVSVTDGRHWRLAVWVNTLWVGLGRACRSRDPPGGRCGRA